MLNFRNPSSFFEELAANPVEALDVELKSWVKPTSKTGKAILVKALFALRHYRVGGFLLIGFDDKTRQPIPSQLSNRRIQETYHPDKIQKLVFDFSYDAFEVHVTFQERDGQVHPIVCVDEGVTEPVYTKKSLASNTGKLLVKKDTIYVRTLRANGTVSSAQIGRLDWPDLIDTFVQNRSRIIRPVERPTSPDSASLVAKAWNDFTASAQQLLWRHGYPTKKTFRGLGKTLNEAGLIGTEHSSMINRLRNMRNYAAHVGANAIAQRDADEAQRLSESLCNYFESIRGK